MKEEIGFRHKLSSAYYPQTNGLTERFNGTLCRSLAKSL
jgi:transposase InsO family protein